MMVMESVVGTPFDDGSATLTADTVAAAFWQLYQDRGPSDGDGTSSTQIGAPMVEPARSPSTA